MLVSVDQTLDECSELLHIFIHIIFDLNDLFVQAVIAVSPMAGVHFPNCQTKVFVRYDLFVNSNDNIGCRILAKPQANPPFGSQGPSPFLYRTVDRTALAEEKPTGHSLVHFGPGLALEHPAALERL